MTKEKKVPIAKTISTNRRALAKYDIIETMEAGIVLTGPEVKSLRAGDVNLQDGFARVDGEELYLWNVHIKPYAYGSLHVTQEPTRKRKLLVHKQEIRKLIGKTALKGYTIVPLELYFGKTGRAKVKIALAKGKNAPDRRDDIKKKDLRRDMERQFAGKFKLK